MSLVSTDAALSGRIAPTSLAVHRGELVALIGPNGGGKTSLLRALAQVEDATGDVQLDGRPLGDQRRRLAYMSADRAARWPIPVADLVRLGNEPVDPPRLAAMMERFELMPLAGRRADSLSTGEQARVAMARMLLSDAGLLLFDEPLANLDPWWVAVFLDELAARAAQGDVLIVALHDLARLDRFDRVLLVAERKVTADGTPAAVASSPQFRTAFRMDAAAAGVRLADPRSSR